MEVWYKDASRMDLKRLQRASGWKPLVFMFAVFLIVAALGIAAIYWIIEGKAIENHRMQMWR